MAAFILQPRTLRQVLVLGLTQYRRIVDLCCLQFQFIVTYVSHCKIHTNYTVPEPLASKGSVYKSTHEKLLCGNA